MPVRPWLTVVPPLRGSAPRAPFVLLVATLLTFGLGALLFLHTALAEDSFHLHDLRARSLVLADREQSLERAVSAAAAPQRLALRARALGMVRSENPVFISTSDGRILGVPKAGVRPAPKAPSSAVRVPTPAPSSAAAGRGKAKKKATPSKSPQPAPSHAATAR